MLPLLLLAAPAFAARGASPLADAMEKDDPARVRSLLQQGADANAAQVDGMTALHWAAYYDDLATARRLVAAHADVNAANRYGVKPLSLACTNGDTELVELLLKAGADPNTQLPGGESVLMTAARTGRAGPVRALLARKASVNAKERSGQTPLCFAAREGRREVVQVLLKAGADVNEAMQPQRPGGRNPRKGAGPLLLAVENGHFELAIDLVRAGADPNDQRSGYTPLHAVTWVRRPKSGDDPDGDPPPIGSGSMSSLQFVRELAARGARVNERLQHGASGRAKLNETGATPFLFAAHTADVALMRLLVELGADPTIPNADNCPPLLAAAGIGVMAPGEEPGTEDETVEALKYLLQLGADVNAVDNNGETAMHGAAYRSAPRAAAFLAAHGADINIWNRANHYGWTPFLIAEGHRVGNFKVAPETIAEIRRIMLANGVTPPKPTPAKATNEEYEAPKGTGRP